MRRNGAVVSPHHPSERDCQLLAADKRHTPKANNFAPHTHRDGSSGAAGEVGVAATTRNADPVARQAVGARRTRTNRRLLMRRALFLLCAGSQLASVNDGDDEARSDPTTLSAA